LKKTSEKPIFFNPPASGLISLSRITAGANPDITLLFKLNPALAPT